MPTGRPSKWVTAKGVEPIEHGIRWYPYKAKKPYRISWDHLTKHATNGAS